MFVQKLDIKSDFVVVVTKVERFDKKGHFNPRDPDRGRIENDVKESWQTNKQTNRLKLAKVTPISIADGESQMIVKRVQSVQTDYQDSSLL